MDPRVLFPLTVHALLRPDSIVLDFGAGRGECDLGLRGNCAAVHGCDVDEAVLSNPFVDHPAVVSGRLPYPDATFDLIVARYVFEHVREPEAVAAELLRVLKPGGHVVAVTPNRRGYVALAAMLVPNRLHRAVLRLVQPERPPEDIFPTCYRMNTPEALARLFPSPAISLLSGPPEYHFGRAWVARLFTGLHRLLPERLQTAMVVTVRKPSHQTVAEKGVASEPDCLTAPLTAH